MRSNYPRGSEWRKWDLHVHLPGTKLSDGYIASGQNVIDKFCDELEASDVQVFGITDYFSLDKFFVFKSRFQEKFPSSIKVFFPNIELRLNESVNTAQEEINWHVILPPDVTQDKANEFLQSLKTELTDSNRRKFTCAELTEAQYASATVTRESLTEAVKSVFGEKVERQDHILVITAANNDGVRPARGAARKENITDQVDKFSDAYFGGSQNTTYFLKTDRLEDPEQRIEAKPVYSCSDAHSFENLSAWLGKELSEEGVSKEVTWIKGNPTFAGLQQTLIEPEERVRIQAVKPDEKEAYKYISKVKFTGTNDFPDEILLNGNLNAIIGSRSSGKSALLAYIAHSINADDTIQRQMTAQEITSPEKMGPAAGKTWQSVNNITCTVEWAIGGSEDGKVIYIPQNYLYSISKRPSEITKKIEPVLFANYQTIKTQYDQTINDVSGSNSIIREAASEWFSFQGTILATRAEISNLGDRRVVEAAKNEYQAKIDALKANLSLSEEDLQLYRQISENVSQKRARQVVIENEIAQISPFYNDDPDNPSATNIHPSITFFPALSGLPTTLVDQINTVSESAADQIKVKVGQKIVSYRATLGQEKDQLTQEIQQITTTNSDLINKVKQNNELNKLVDSSNKQAAIITAIEAKESKITELESKKTEQEVRINAALSSRKQALEQLKLSFTDADQTTSEMSYGVEIDYDPKDLDELSEKYDRRENSPYLEQQQINISKIKGEVGAFLKHLDSSQKLRANQDKKQAAIATLCLTEEIRFNATLEGDKIGGFTMSSMTPGKQALFALTLILDESDDAWPLLVDQPEDDLDSRSMYDYIVPYLIKRKKERQIIMVSHNANLVVGADSEQLIIANRHGEDRKNRDSRTFDYLTGALEDSQTKIECEYTLESCGIREHAIEILDGGKEAFEKRKNKYKI